MQHKPVKYYKGNTLKQLRAFCSVARTGKMTDAAAELFLSQSAISLQIKALEEELDAVLFERRGPPYGIVLRRGKHLSLQARAFLDEIPDTPLSQSPGPLEHSSR